MKRKIIKLLGVTIVLLVIVMLSGCGMGKVSKNTLETDIINNDIIQYIYLSNYTNQSEYKLNECKVTKEQVNRDNKEDIIYCDIEVENQYFIVEASLQVLYNYYDKGGWILENIAVIDEVTNVTQIASPEQDLIINEITESVKDANTNRIKCIFNEKKYNNSMDSFYITNLNYNKDSNSCQIDIEAADEYKEIYGYYLAEFNINGGWKLHNFATDINEDNDEFYGIFVSSVYSDYSSTLGKFYLNTFLINDELLSTEVLTIESITDNKIKYSIDNFSYETDFDPINGSFELYYKIEGDTRYTYGTCYYRKQSSCWYISGDLGDVRKIISAEPLTSMYYTLVLQ